MPTYSTYTIFNGVDRVSNAFINMGRSAQRFRGMADGAFRGASKSGSIFSSVVGGSLVANGIANIASGLMQVPGAVKKTAQEAQALGVSFESVFGNQATAQMKFVEKTAFSLGLGVESAANAYKDISAAAKGSAISGDQVQAVFLGVSKAATSLQLNSEMTGGALTALSQMISKGKVQAEELRGQLGERIPGAFQIAARAMNMTTSELDKFMSNGQLTADKFIPAFAAQLEKEFGQSAIKASQSFQAAEQRFNNTVYFFKRDIGGVLLPALGSMYGAVSEMLEPLSQWVNANKQLIATRLDSFVKTITDTIKTMTPIVKGIFTFLANNIGTIKNLAIAFGIWQASIVLATIALKGMAVVGMIGNLLRFINIIYKVARAKTVWAAAQKALNLAMAMNPIGLITAAIFVLIGAGYLLVKNWDTVKKFFQGLWNGILNNKIVQALLIIFLPFIGLPILIIKNWGVIKEFFINMWGGIKIAFSASVDFMTKALFTFADVILSTYGNIFKMIIKGAATVGRFIGLDVSGLDTLVKNIDTTQKDVRAKSFIGGNNEKQAPNAMTDEQRNAMRGQGMLTIRAEKGTEVTGFENGLKGIDTSFAGKNYVMAR